MLNEMSDIYMFQYGIMFIEVYFFLKNVCGDDKSVREK